MNRPCHALSRPAVSLVATAMLAAVSSTAGATTLVKMDLPEMVKRADAIVIGHARSAESIWVGRELYTRYRIEVQQQLLGTATAEVHVVVPGGVDRNRRHPIAVTIADAPALHSGEHVALILERGTALGASDFRIVGFNQGRIALDHPPGRSALTAGGPAVSEAVLRAQRVERLKQRLQPMIDTRGASGAYTKRPEAPRAALRGHSEVLGGGR